MWTPHSCFNPRRGTRGLNSVCFEAIFVLSGWLIRKYCPSRNSNHGAEPKTNKAPVKLIPITLEMNTNKAFSVQLLEVNAISLNSGKIQFEMLFPETDPSLGHL